ncbi:MULTISPECIES: DUF3970 family protein [Bacillus cereus group]|uniref:DUF3970 domain-containing protein n=4 Tax=Bacillus cereus group TaxID=86661 RepID=A0A0J1KNH1_BACAN|nr:MULTISPECIES: DUF3970 family protein [Bacillus cereus group]AJI08769.1 hypothetical protein AK40_5517 [Bacillus cereus 03BB108]EDX60029.1 conserved domain protein [Bacillus cereus 03BB108]EOQ19559.1 hypothetical protein IKC_04033 [Bacillus cereus VD184]KLV18240.1 hypothetical protein ABW01_12705 [Bacillus anthracis]MCC3686959.1 YvzF family protein [Bacillus cereus]
MSQLDLRLKGSKEDIERFLNVISSTKGIALEHASQPRKGNNPKYAYDTNVLSYAKVKFEGEK